MHKANQAIKAATEKDKMLDLVEKDFKAAIINMFEVQKESMLKELQEDVKMMSHQRDNINKEKYSNY